MTPLYSVFAVEEKIFPDDAGLQFPEII